MIISHSNIYELRLLKDIGYAYIRVVNPDLVLNRNTSSVLIEVFDYFSSEPLKDDFDVKKISKNGIILNLLMLPVSRIRKEMYIKKIGEFNLKDDFEIPDFAICSNKTLGKPERYSWYSWDIISNLSNKFEKSTYKSCKSLSIYQHLSFDLIIVRLTMEWILRRNEKIKKYFDKVDFSKNWYKVLYNQTVHFPGVQRIKPPFTFD